MKKQYYFRFSLIAVIIFLCIYQVYPPEKKIRKGLDLKGGVHVVLELTETAQDEKTISDLADRALEVIRNRIDALGVTEPVIQKEGMKRIIVDLPGVQDPDKAIEIIGQTALLEFKLVSDDPDLLKSALEGNVPEGYQLVYY
ncbi:MAG: hypothetical protein NC824_05770, partial [Candidatus Omnitrophica bacterium]|nr:hypothetical protein [Candidatus Omnitrophota bacterium]